MPTLHYQIIPRKQRITPILNTIRSSSKLFKAQLADADIKGMENTSIIAWDALANLFEILRNEQDEGNLALSYMTVQTGFIVKDTTRAEQQAMISARKLDRSHANFGPMSLRDALNKIAHYNTSRATFRVDGRGAHYLLLGGSYQGKNWVAEILVSRLCKNAAIAARAIK